MNTAILRGFVTREPFIAEGKTKTAMFTLACQDREMPKDSQGNFHTDFIKVVCFNYKGLATVVSKYVEKGTELIIEGKISSNSYQRTNEDGFEETVYTTEVVANSLEFVSRARKSNASEETTSNKGKKSE